MRSRKRTIGELRLAATILTLSFVGLLLILSGFWNELRTAIPNLSAGTVISIPLGATPDQISSLLEQKRVIRHAWLLKAYIKMQDRGRALKAGDYIFDSPISPLDVLKKLESGEQGANKITIVEGWTRWDIASAMAQMPALHLRSSNDVLGLIENPRAIADLDPDATSLEGYMFPDTYFALSNSKAADILDKAVAEFKLIWKKNLAPIANAENKSVHEVVIVASIIETEAKLKSERPIIASVIYNRLKNQMPLGMDSTIVYASKLAGRWRDDGKVYQSDIDRDSPYNTRKFPGLPIGPVGCPGISSLEAALKPAHTNYIYYVRNPLRNDGAHNFYSDQASFQKGVLALRNWEKQRDQPIIRYNQITKHGNKAIPK